MSTSEVTKVTIVPRQDHRAGRSPQPFLKNAWYVAMWAQELVRGHLAARKIMNESLVFLRKEDGTAVAMDDRCPHRFAPLHMGKVLPGDRIQCPYHGLQFDAGGTCVHNPHGAGAIPPSARVRSYPVVEKHLCLWVWMGDRPPDESKIPDFGILDMAPKAHMTRPDGILVQSHYQLVVDNLLDLSHAMYLHDGILATADSAIAEIKIDQAGDSVTVSRYAHGVPIVGLHKVYWLHEGPGDRFSEIRWDAPSSLLLRQGVCHPGQNPSEGSGYYGVHFLTPETESTTAYHFIALRFGVHTPPEDDEAINLRIAETRLYAFAEQDAPVIEAQQRSIDGATQALNPALLSIDAGLVRCKRVLERLLQDD
jgi:phenylpropionate dioxygenase-like ring-hydroxylating dioxygenase large terminal subunit